MLDTAVLGLNRHGERCRPVRSANARVGRRKKKCGRVRRRKTLQGFLFEPARVPVKTGKPDRRSGATQS